MDFSSAKSERITAIVSTLVAVAILAGGVTAFQSHNAPIDDVVQLESDLRFQLEVAFKHDPNERAARLVQLEKVSQAWQQSPRVIADRAKLASWLLEATIRSMPGSFEALPAVPNFGEQPQQQAVKQMPDVLVTPPVAAAKVAAKSDSEQLFPTPAPVESIMDAQPETLVDPTIAVVESVESHVFRKRPKVEPVALPQSTVAVAVPQAVEPVRINLTELAARITGYHDGLDEVETALLTLEVNDFTTLAAQIRQLEEMTHDFRFVSIYFELLTDDERRAVTAPRPMTATLAEIERRLDRSQAVRSGDFLEEFDSSNQEQIAKLRGQLSQIASRVDR